MSKEKVYILGAGGMAREVKSYYDQISHGDRVGGFVEQNSQRSGEDLKGKIIIDALNLSDPEAVDLIAAIGSPQRKKWVEELHEKGYRFDTLVHHEAYVGKDVKLGEGCIICPGAVLTTDIIVGDHSIVNVRSSISHDCKIGKFVTISPGASIGGNVEIGDESWVGIGATIIQQVRIGKRVFIAAGAVVVDDIPDDSLVMGIPGKVVRTLTPDLWKTLI